MARFAYRGRIGRGKYCVWRGTARLGAARWAKAWHGMVRFFYSKKVHRMALQEMTVKIRGVSPLLMHNGQTADPLNKFSKQLKAVSKKTKKTDEDHAEMSRIEWHAGLYTNEDGKLIIPSTLIEASIQDGAKKSKLGKAFKSAVFVNDDAVLDIGNNKKAADLWGDDQYRDVRGVRIGQSRVMRTRPVFNQWRLNFVLYFDDEQVNKSDVVKAINDAGSKAGLGDFRPRFGRFETVDE
jgi:hypothetical protein